MPLLGQEFKKHRNKTITELGNPTTITVTAHLLPSYHEASDSFTHRTPCRVISTENGHASQSPPRDIPGSECRSLCVSVCLCGYVCVCISLYLWVSMYVYICFCVNICVYLCTCLCLCVCMSFLSVYVSTYMYIHMYVSVCERVCVCMCVCVCVSVYLCVLACVTGTKWIRSHMANQSIFPENGLSF